MNSTAHPRPAVLPWPLVKPYRHPLRWMHNLLLRLVAAVVLAHVGTLVVVALYYLLTQKIPGAKRWWDGNVQPPSLRHTIRDVAEGVLGGCLARAVVWDHYKHLKDGFAERMKEKSYIPRKLVAPFLALIYGAAAFVVIYYALHAAGVHAMETSHSAHASLWARTKPVWTSNWDKKAIGFIVAFVASRPLFPIFDSVQLWFVARRVARGQALRIYHPAPFQARFNELNKKPGEVVNHGAILNSVLVAGLVIGLGLAGYGYWILTYRA